MHGNMMVALETDSIFGTPSKKDDVTITFWAVNILVGNVFMIAYCLGINVHGKLSLFFTKTSNNSNATRHQKLFTISTRNLSSRLRNPQMNLQIKNKIYDICVRLKFENVNYSSEINRADARTSNTSTRLWFYYIITKIYPTFQNPGSAPVKKGAREFSNKCFSKSSRVQQD